MELLSKYLRDSRIEMVEEYVMGDVLDIGCGFGNVFQRFNNRITNYYGIEYDVDHVAKLQIQYPVGKFFARDLNEDDLVFEQKFDVILIIALIEHIFNQKHLMVQTLKNLKTNGKIVITTPTPFGNDIVHRLGVSLGLFSREAADDHIVIYNKRRFEILSQALGLNIIRYKKFQMGCNQLVVLKKIKPLHHPS